MNAPMDGSHLPVPQPDRRPLPRDFWYVVCATAELSDTPLARRFHGHDIVVFRSGDGAPIVLHDRCPHRGVALSLGKVSEGVIACAYHGWRFGAGGACAHIPSLIEGREIAARVGVRSFPCAERDGYVWAWAGDDEPEATAPPPISGFNDRVWMQGALDLACEAMLPIENNLDLAHPYFTHPGLHPQWFAVEQFGFRELTYHLAPSATGLVVTAGKPGRGLRIAFDLPDRVTVEGVVEAPIIIVHHTPTRPGRCRQHWLVSLAPASPDTPHAVRWTDK